MTSSYLTLQAGTPVTDRFGQPVGGIKRVLIAEAQYFDGVIVTCPAGDRFVDAPEVRRIADGEVELAHKATMLRNLDALLADLG